ncbi:MAG TPA: enterochelin esterase [Pyrinomonadaceae bacterium]|nr:enterochelin esterase [Pyrinomonadaceae bacterium]
MSARNIVLTAAFILLAVGPTSNAQTSNSPGARSPSSPRVAALQNQLRKGDRAAVAGFWEEVRKAGTPLVESIPGDGKNVLVTFLWRGAEETRNVVVFLQTGGLNPADNQMTHVPGSDVWHRSYVFPKDARFLYKLSPNDDLTPLDTPGLDWQKRFAHVQTDPLNSKRYPPGAGAAEWTVQSVVELPRASPQPWVARRARVVPGKVERHKIKSGILNNERNLWVYLPASYQAGARGYSLLILFDGQSYLDLVPTPTILDNLIADGKIPPVVAVLVDNPGPAERDRELPCYRPFADFLSKELLPWVRERYGVTTDPRGTVIAGSSYGGLAATCAAMWYPGDFGNFLSQSASYWWKPETDSEYEWVRRQFSVDPKLPLRAFLTVGLLETIPKPGHTNQVEVNRRLRDTLKAKGYEVTYTEFDGAHEYINWQGTLADGLIALLGKRKH